MAYNDFSLDLLKQRFGIKIDEEVDIFSGVPPIPVGDLLRETLRENVPLGLAISTEKARSELIITPILLEVRRQLQRRISFFSGVEFTVDPDQGLNGTCDYLLSTGYRKFDPGWVGELGGGCPLQTTPFSRSEFAVRCTKSLAGAVDD